MLISEIASILQATFLAQSEDLAINTIVYDSRKATGSANELFIALPGSNHDGHEYIPALIQRGCKNFLVAKKIQHSSSEINILQVKDVMASFQILAQTHRAKFQIPVVGITGSNGKTIVKEWLSTLLSHQFEVAKSPKSFNSQLGVPLSLWPLNESHEIGVFEAGVSKKGEMQRLANMIQPSIGIFTNIGEAHSEGFESLEQKLEEKALLFADCQQVICRYEHSIIRSHLVKQSSKLISWGIDEPKAHINFHKTDIHHYHTKVNNVPHNFHIPWTNDLDLENLFHVISAALRLGESEANIQKGIDELKAVPMRLELKRGQNNCYILDDTYNNDLLGLQVALDYLKQQPHKSKTTVILSDILQSGKTAEELYQAVNLLMKNHGVSQLVGIGQEISNHQNQFDLPFQGFNSVNDFLKAAPLFADETILVKGARKYGLEKIVGYLEEKSHGTVMEVNFEAITHNLNVYRSKLDPSTKLMVMVKAFAYGVGVEEIAHLLQYHQVDYLGVAYLDEAINLRRKGIDVPIMIMNVNPDSLGILEPFNLEPEIYSIGMLNRLLDETDTPPPIHLKIESGMNRLGFTVDQLEELIGVLKQNTQVRVAGIFTHFSSADSSSEDEYTDQQANAFNQAYDLLSAALGYQPIKHAVNSAGIVRKPEYQFDMVRLGIGLYGFDSSNELPGLKTISTLKTKISQIKRVKAGESIGYSRKGKPTTDSEIATIAIGYADGYTRLFGNGKAYVLVNGQQAPTIGNICMDMTMIDVTGLMAKEGDEVIIFGEKPNISELAHWSSTIPYEILTNVSQRVKRVFVSE